MKYPLVLENVSKSFKDGDSTIHIVKNLSFQAEAGQFTAVIGPSGSGKSTFLSIAGALLSPDSGNVYINDKNITQFTDKEKAQVRLKDIGYIFQSSNLIPYLTVKEQLKIVLQMSNKKDSQQNKYMEELLTSVGLLSRINHYPHQLSGGEKQRVAIARAFANDPAIILADEPTASLDPNRSVDIATLIAKQAKEKNKAAVMVTHDEAILPLCDEVYRMENGKLVKV
ncbi:ABC transporter ATP-binding protein [Bacillus sp. FJAT-42315]|uniref:ABC transporter ATP-binding protein n=1 Tax=Bacillus sp. FJAT-42315 TaxID=2014077 RepID=UPI000C24693D|nr:ABC transporter ATP-binding protein [Bacillus sp. FJAT-42315]